MIWSDRTDKRDAVAAELFFRVFFYVGLILLFAFPVRTEYAQMQLWRFEYVTNAVCVAAVAAGLLFTWWARIHLGRLWSDRVVKKVGHWVADTGPYKLVRHGVTVSTPLDRWGCFLFFPRTERAAAWAGFSDD